MSPRADITGNASSVRGIIDVYDVFGFMSQTLQGADRLADSLDALVIVPDFFEGQSFPAWAQARDTEEKKEAVSQFLAGAAAFPKNVDTLHRVATEAKQKWSGIEKWAVFGLCWGGKIAALVSGPGTVFKASGQTHPAGLAVEDANKMSIPHICLASKDEPGDVVGEYTKIISTSDKKGMVETYSSMFHGWMGGRAKLEDEQNAKEFERG
ncbi:MAG: hypothetical protein Q9227_005941 [Pyrenula ochraceoflavens]